MRFKTILLSAALGCSVGLLADARIETTAQRNAQISFGVGEAAARSLGQTRRVARRTSRRTSRRVVRRHSALPMGCPRAGAYYYCGGIYYQPVVESGTTVYIIVTP